MLLSARQAGRAGILKRSTGPACLSGLINATVMVDVVRYAELSQGSCGTNNREIAANRLFARSSTSYGHLDRQSLLSKQTAAQWDW